MTTLYSLTIYASLVLLAIAVAIFVFAASLYRGASKLAAKDEEEFLNMRKKLIEEKKTAIGARIRKASDNHITTELRQELDSFENEVNPLKLDQIRPPIVYSEMLS